MITAVKAKWAALPVNTRAALIGMPLSTLASFPIVSAMEPIFGWFLTYVLFTVALTVLACEMTSWWLLRGHRPCTCDEGVRDL